MRRVFSFVVVVLLASSMAATTLACGEGPFEPSRSSETLTVSVKGTINVDPSLVSKGSNVLVSWTGSSSVRVDACDLSHCVAIATGGNSVQHTPTSRGQWKYVLYGVVSAPDAFVRVAEKTVTVQ